MFNWPILFKIVKTNFSFHEFINVVFFDWFKNLIIFLKLRMRLNSCFTQLCRSWSNHLNLSICFTCTVWSLHWFSRHWSRSWLFFVNIFCPCMMVSVRMRVDTLVLIGVTVFNLSEDISRMITLVHHRDILVIILCPVVHLRWRQVVWRVSRARSAPKMLVSFSISCTARLLSLSRTLSDVNRLRHHRSSLSRVHFVNILK